MVDLHIPLRFAPQRYIISVACLFALTISYMMRFCLSLAITQMTEIASGKKDPNACPYIEKDNTTTAKTKEFEFSWSSNEQGLIHGGFFWGYFLTQVVGGVLSDLYNHKTVLLAGLLGTCVSTIITPVATRLYDWIGLIVCRVAVGLFQGVFYNALHAVTAHWIPLQERGILGTVVFSGVHLGNCLHNLISGFLMAYFDWPVVFYLYSSIGFLVALIFALITYPDPSDFPGLEEKEKAVFEVHKLNVSEEKKGKAVPLKKILLNIHVWAIVLAMFGQDWCTYSVVTQIPSYLDSVLHFDVEQNGYYNALIYAVIWLIGLCAGSISDFMERKELVSLSLNRRILYLVATVPPSCGLIAVSYAGCNRVLSVIFLVAGLSTMGFFYPSVKVNPIDLSPNFAGTIGSIGQMGGCIAGIIVPAFFGLVTPNKFLSEWRIAFWVSFAAIMFGGLSFFSLGSAKIQAFNEYQVKTEAGP